MTDLTTFATGVPRKIVDRGDGTYAERVDVAGSTATDASGTITTGGAAQNALAANLQRHEWTFVNNSDTLMMVRVGGTASATAGIPVYPGDVVSGQENNAISVYCATTGKAFTAWER